MHFPLSFAQFQPSHATWGFIATHPQPGWHVRVHTGKQAQVKTIWEDICNAMLERLQWLVVGVLLNRDAARWFCEPLPLRLERMHGDASAVTKNERNRVERCRRSPEIPGYERTQAVPRTGLRCRFLLLD